jgi:hypothetical protein
MSTKETAGILAGIGTLVGTFWSMLDPTFLISTSDIWFPMVAYAARFGPDVGAIPWRALLTIATVLFVGSQAVKLYERRQEHD